jgi:UDP-hydrolysing UDP-N-acetyl-D-glucosamine 2-epimerase
MKRKICAVITARTSYSKFRSILISLKQIHWVELQIILTGSAIIEKYGSIESILIDDGLWVNEKVSMLLQDATLVGNAKSTGLGIIELVGVFSRLSPDIVLVMADRFEIMAPSVAACYMNICLAHVQGGEVTGNIDEKVRHAVSKLADIHFPATKKAYKNLISLGENRENIFLVGCPSMDLAKEVLNNPKINFNIYEKYKGVGVQPTLKGDYIIVMQHPVTTDLTNAQKHILETLEAVKSLKCSVLWFWPNPDSGTDEVSKTIRTFKDNNDYSHVHFFKNMEPLDFLKILNSSIGIIGNSSVAIREASFLGIPAINIGDRQKDRERSDNVVDVGYCRQEIMYAMKTHFTGKKSQSYLYGLGDSGQRIAQILSTVKIAHSKKLVYNQE